MIDIPDTDTSLLHRAQRKDLDAWYKIEQLYAPLIRYWIQKYGLHREVIEDITQETFLAVNQQIPILIVHKNGAKFRGWLKQVVKGKVSDYFAKKKRTAEGAGGDDAQCMLANIASPEDESEATLSEERMLLFRQVISIIQREFSERDYRIFLRNVVDGLSAKEIAAEFGVSEASVYTIKSRIVAKCRTWFEGLVDDMFQN